MIFNAISRLGSEVGYYKAIVNYLFDKLYIKD